MRNGIGLDIGSTSVRMAAVRTGKGGPVLVNFARGELTSGDTAADLPDPSEITSCVKYLAKSEHLPKGQVSLGLANQRMVAREVEIPWVPEKDLRAALPLLAADQLPMPVEESVLDFLPFQEVVDDEGQRMLQGLLVAANEDVVMSAVEAVERAGLTVDRVDFGPLGALHAVCDPFGGEIEAVVDVGSRTTCLVVHEGNRPTFVRVMASGGADTTEDLAENLGIDVQMAETWKVGLEQLWPTMSAVDKIATRQALEHASASLVDEIRSSLAFYQSNSGSRVSRLWLIGGGGSQYGLDYQLREALHVEVRRASPVQRLAGVKVSAERVASYDPSMATAVGLALGVAS